MYVSALTLSFLWPTSRPISAHVLPWRCRRLILRWPSFEDGKEYDFRYESAKAAMDRFAESTWKSLKWPLWRDGPLASGGTPNPRGGGVLLAHAEAWDRAGSPRCPVAAAAQCMRRAGIPKHSVGGAWTTHSQVFAKKRAGA